MSKLSRGFRVVATAVPCEENSYSFEDIESIRDGDEDVAIPCRNARQLTQHGSGIFQVLQHVRANHAVKAAVGKPAQTFIVEVHLKVRGQAIRTDFCRRQPINTGYLDKTRVYQAPGQPPFSAADVKNLPGLIYPFFFMKSTKSRWRLI